MFQSRGNGGKDEGRRGGAWGGSSRPCTIDRILLNQGVLYNGGSHGITRVGPILSLKQDTISP